MKRFFAVVAAGVLGLLFIIVITATQAVAAHQPPIDHGYRLSLPVNVQHSQPITPGAPADIVLVLDRSESQSYQFNLLPEPYASKCNQTKVDDLFSCVNGGTLSGGTTIVGCNNEPVNDSNFPELTRGICQPFRKSKEAAYRFIQQLRLGTDRVALISFAESPAQGLTLTLDLSRAISAVNNMDVYVPRPDGADGHIPCNVNTPPQDLWKCGSSNIGGGLIQAREEFSSARPEAKWATVVIADGAANRTSYDPRVPWSDSMYGTCPLSEQATPVRCRDGDANSRHFITATVDPLYDADDYAREYGDIVGLDPNLYPSLNSAGVRMFTIGIGKNMVCHNGTFTPPGKGQPATCTDFNPAYGDPDAGEQLLKYIADIGYEGNFAIGPCLGPKSTSASTWGIPLNPLDFSARSSQLGLPCGNYYFAPDATSLPTITLDIARRIIAADWLLPDFSAAPLNGVAPLSVTFNNLSIGPYTNTRWTFGDGNTSTAISPTHAYADPGAYTVTLTIANITTTASLTRTNYIDVSTPHWWFYLPIIHESS